MDFDMGLHDRLFGKRTTIEIPGPDGSIRKVSVTVSWLEHMERTGKMTPVEEGKVVVHFLNPMGPDLAVLGVPANPNKYFMAAWTIGKEVTAEQCNKFLDPESNALYVLIGYKDGHPGMVMLPREKWEVAKKGFEQFE